MLTQPMKLEEEKKKSSIIKEIALDSIKKSNIEEKEITITKVTEERKYKRGYDLKESTIRKLLELQALHYPIDTSLNSIVEEAIKVLYTLKKESSSLI